ncbi:hypothetical protein BDV29DRAFT_189364 [Aspergillus leporis]|uniref:Xylanolytic transcriptional activator regulatory domain-containing protein n=1 Tax=Aspergillus leporis TaxID=41062 RepID=A0A5N5X7C8_9EURO|nr:hypothetical protein BDV29DRAFT_189364 [Aspergillus leporis]
MPESGTARFHFRFQGCSASYRRKEHLHHLGTQHTGAQAASCLFCDRTFCGRKARRCFENRVTQPETPDAHSWPSASLDLPNSMFDNDGPETKIEQWPILHRATFSASHESSLLLYSVVMIGMWVSGKDSCRKSALDLHSRLGSITRDQQAAWQDLTIQADRTASAWPIATYQGPSLSVWGILTALVRTCLRRNIFLYPVMLGRVEEIKRLGLVLHKVCKICRSTCQGESQEASDSRLLRLSNLGFPGPDSNELWEAGSNPELSNLLAKIYKHRILYK